MAGLHLYRFEVIAANSLEVGLTGMVTYPQRIALPPQALVIVQLVDVSLADAPAEVIDEQIITAGGQQPPYNFDLLYKPLKIQQNHTYAVQARIEVQGELPFINTTRYPVLTQNAPDNIVYSTDPAQTSVLVFTKVVGDDSVVAQEVRVDLAALADNQWQVEWAGVRWQCARGDNTTDLSNEFCLNDRIVVFCLLAIDG